MAKLDPIIGRYVTLSQDGKDFRIYFEERMVPVSRYCVFIRQAHIPVSLDI